MDCPFRRENCVSVEININSGDSMKFSNSTNNSSRENISEGYSYNSAIEFKTMYWLVRTRETGNGKRAMAVHWLAKLDSESTLEFGNRRAYIGTYEVFVPLFTALVRTR